MLPRNRYIFTVRRSYPPLFISLMYKGMSTPLYYRHVLDASFSLQQQIVVDGVWYYNKEEIRRGSQLVFESWRQPQNLERAKQYFLDRELLIDKTARGTDFELYASAFESYMPALILVWFAEDPVDKKIRQLLSNELVPKEIEKLMYQLNIPLEDNYYKQEEHDLITTLDIDAHVKKYEWLNSRYGEAKPYTVNEAKKRRALIDKDSYFKNRKKEKTLTEKAVKQAKEILGNSAPLVDLMRFIIYYRTQRTDVMNRSFYLFIEGFKKLAAEYGLSYRQLLYCLENELMSGIASADIANERIKDNAMLLEDGKISCVTGTEAQKIRNFIGQEKVSENKLRGKIAFPGVVAGTVRLVFSEHEFSKVQNGDILVTSMTSPRMVPIMKIAGAIVTDEGGITCHAAIISRELGKPCIIGTKVATRVLKDGDRVQVDANNGIIRKI